MYRFLVSFLPVISQKVCPDVPKHLKMREEREQNVPKGMAVRFGCGLFGKPAGVYVCLCD